MGSRGTHLSCVWSGCLVALASLAVISGPAIGQQTVGGMLVPNGEVLTGPVVRRNGTSVDSITTGADANAYILSTPPTQSFVNGAPAAVVRTSVPSLYVRAYTQDVTNPVGGFVAPINVVRGLTAGQIRDVLALPFLPTSLTLVEVPAGTCVLYGQGAPILGNFAANPPAIPTAGPWGRGGALQGVLIGPSSQPGCADAGFVPAQNFTSRQAIGDFALAYRPNAGKGNSYAVAAALDTGSFPAQFSDMDGVYNSLDTLNFSSPPALQMALKQLGGEAYADYGYIRMASGRQFLDVMLQQMRSVRSRGPIAASPAIAEAPTSLTEPAAVRETASAFPQPFIANGGSERRSESGGVWLAPYGSFGNLYGDASTHGMGYTLHGFAGGGDMRLADSFLIGAAVSYSSTAFSTSVVSSAGSNEAVAVAAYASYAPGAWYIDAAAGYSYNWGALSRTIAFPGVLRTAQGNPTAHQFLGSIESGLALPINPRLAVTPFGRLDVTTAAQNGFSETGAGAIGLNVSSQTTTGVRSILGLQLSGTAILADALSLWLAARAGWAHDYADLSGSLTANFLGKPDTSFTTLGPTPDRNAAMVGVSANFLMKAAQAFINYDANLSQSYTTHSMTLGLKVRF